MEYGDREMPCFHGRAGTGLKYKQHYHRLALLVKNGKASWYMPYRNVTDAIARSGL